MEVRRAPRRTPIISCGDQINLIASPIIRFVLKQAFRQNILSPIIGFSKPDNRTQNPIIRLVETGCYFQEWCSSPRSQSRAPSDTGAHD